MRVVSCDFRVVELWLLKRAEGRAEASQINMKTKKIFSGGFSVMLSDFSLQYVLNVHCHRLF